MGLQFGRLQASAFDRFGVGIVALLFSLAVTLVAFATIVATRRSRARGAPLVTGPLPPNAQLVINVS